MFYRDCDTEMVMIRRGKFPTHTKTSLTCRPAWYLALLLQDSVEEKSYAMN